MLTGWESVPLVQKSLTWILLTIAANEARIVRGPDLVRGLQAWAQNVFPTAQVWRVGCDFKARDNRDPVNASRA
jgi:hypothetical protein